MNQLIIQKPNGDDVEILVSVQIGEIDPALATVAILSALNAIPKPRKQRSDKGVKKATT